MILCAIACYALASVKGSHLGGAYGFKITSLTKLTNTLANAGRPKTNFMHYLVTVGRQTQLVLMRVFSLCKQVCEFQRPQLLAYPGELEHLEQASR